MGRQWLPYLGRHAHRRVCGGEGDDVSDRLPNYET